MDTVKNGKGSKPRPVDKNKYNNNYDEIDWSKHRENNIEKLTEQERGEIAAQMSKI